MAEWTAREMGKKGGSAKSERKTLAVRENAKRPRKKIGEEMKLTQKQDELWRLADKKLAGIGINNFMRDPQRKIEGTFAWAMLQCFALSNPQNDAVFTDEHCQRLIEILSNKQEV